MDLAIDLHRQRPRLDFDHTSLLIHIADSDQILFLGSLWPSTILHTPPPADVRAAAPPVLRRDVPELVTWLMYAEPAYRRRDIYAKWLYDLKDEPDLPGISLEQRLFNEHLIQDLSARGILGPQGHAQTGIDPNGIEHLYWYGPTPRTGEPSVNALGTSGLPVYRLLWPLYMPWYPIPIDRRPVRDTSACFEQPLEPDGHGYPCVLPRHFKISQPRPRGWGLQGYRRIDGVVSNTRLTSGLPSFNVRWDSVDGVRYCRPHQHRLPQRWQDPQFPPPRNTYCAGCYQIRKEVIANPARGRGYTEEKRQLADELMARVRARQEQAEREREQAERQQVEEQALRERLIKDLDLPI
jgi:hypothetical protein